MLGDLGSINVSMHAWVFTLPLATHVERERETERKNIFNLEGDGHGSPIFPHTLTQPSPPEQGC